MFAEDLSLYRPKGQELPGAINIGWLDNKHRFPKGPVSRLFVDRLWLYCLVYVNETRGFDECEFCNDPSNWPVTVMIEKTEYHLGSAEIRVIGQDKRVYAAPNLVYHYVTQHQYLPPDEFIFAVLEGPLPNTKKYGDEREKYCWREKVY